MDFRFVAVIFLKMENLQTEKPVLDRPPVEKPKVDPVLKAKVEELIREEGRLDDMFRALTRSDAV